MATLTVFNPSCAVIRLPQELYLFMRKKSMTIKDLEIAVAFLRRLSVGQLEAEDLIRTVEALEAEITKRKAKK